VTDASKHAPTEAIFVDPFGSTHGSLRTPKGMGDLLPPDAEELRTLTRIVINQFEQCGYDLIVTPLFEHAAVVERGTDALDPRELLRFVEPESGEVAVLRPDITPQIARAVATRLATYAAPWRLCYEGRVIRRRRGRARSHQQITQAGVECVGLAGPEADVEAIELVASACESTLLPEFRIELSHVSIAQSLLDTLPAPLHGPISERLARKDGEALAQLAREANLPADTARHLCALVEHYGDVDMLDSAERELTWPAAQAAISNLRELVAKLDRDSTRARLGFDLSDARNSSYYTGMSFCVLAAGPGEPICSGGRYDQLLQRYGAPQPATGFAFDLENLQWALMACGKGRVEPRAFRVAVGFGTPAEQRCVAESLRKRQLVAATLPSHNDLQSCLAFAKSWGYDAVLALDGVRARLVRTRDASERALAAHDPADIAALQSWAQEATKD
jgi:ATP phosphoribosyltransferase regulatory subunit